jgi:hypothetical protein
VLIRVDLPRPVCPDAQHQQKHTLRGRGVYLGQIIALTNADDIELETALQELALNLRGDAIETNMASGVHRLLRSVSVLNGSHCCETNCSMPRLERCIGESVGVKFDGKRREVVENS